jgi:hypothetical protein
MNPQSKREAPQKAKNQKAVPAKKKTTKPVDELQPSGRRH